MAGLKYYERTKLLIELIEKKQTGNPRELAEKLQVHERTVYRILEEIRLTISDEIAFSKESNSYIFFKNISPTDGKCQ
jgi:transcriptional antiterminator